MLGILLGANGITMECLIEVETKKKYCINE